MVIYSPFFNHGRAKVIIRTDYQIVFELKSAQELKKCAGIY